MSHSTSLMPALCSIRPTDPLTFYSQAGPDARTCAPSVLHFAVCSSASSLDADGCTLPVSQRADGGSDARRAVSHPLLRRLLASVTCRQQPQRAEGAATFRGAISGRLSGGEARDKEQRKYQLAIEVQRENKNKLTTLGRDWR